MAEVNGPSPSNVSAAARKPEPKTYTLTDAEVAALQTLDLRSERAKSRVFNAHAELDKAQAEVEAATKAQADSFKSLCGALEFLITSQGLGSASITPDYRRLISQDVFVELEKAEG